MLDKLDTIDDADKNQCRHYLEAKSSVQNYSVSRQLNAANLIMKMFRIHDSVVRHCFCSPLFSMQQLAKHQLKEAFVKAHLGSWVKKPIEQDLFEVDI